MEKGSTKGTDTDSMESLISSIKEQTNQLKSRALQRTAPDFQSDFSKRQASNEFSRTDLNYSKSLIDNLMSDNKSLHEDIEDFRAALEATLKT
jgi:hypothetical protein